MKCSKSCLGLEYLTHNALVRITGLGLCLYSRAIGIGAQGCVGQGISAYVAAVGRGRAVTESDSGLYVVGGDVAPWAPQAPGPIWK